MNSANSAVHANTTHATPLRRHIFKRKEKILRIKLKLRGKMSSKQIKVSDTFEQSTCGVCGCCEINQYFTINDNFIEYSGTYMSLSTVLNEALDLKVIFGVKS